MKASGKNARATPNTPTSAMQIDVPTFLVYSEGKEIGRVTETPAGRLEEDLASLIAEVGIVPP